MQIIRTSELPTRICLKCRAFLTLAHKFRQICRHSDDFLREYMFKELSEEEKPILEEEQSEIYEEVEVEVLQEGVWGNDELIDEAPVTEVAVEPSRLIVVPVAEPVAAQVVSGRSHVCDICGNSYPRKSTLDTHMRRHNNERPYQCE